MAGKSNGQSVFVSLWYTADGRYQAVGASIESKLAAQKAADKARYAFEKKNPDKPCSAFVTTTVSIPDPE